MTILRDERVPLAGGLRLTLDVISLCIALAVAVVATGVVDATAILPPALFHRSPVRRTGGLSSRLRVLGRIVRGV